MRIAFNMQEECCRKTNLATGVEEPPYSNRTLTICCCKCHMGVIAGKRSCRRLRLRDTTRSRLRRGETIVDLNQLYFDHQLLMIKASQSISARARHEHEVGASHVAGRIGCMQRLLGAAAAPDWEALADVGNTSLAAPVRHQQGYAS